MVNKIKFGRNCHTDFIQICNHNIRLHTLSTYYSVSSPNLKINQSSLFFLIEQDFSIFSLELHLLTGNSIISSASVVRLTESNDLVKTIRHLCSCLQKADARAVTPCLDFIKVTLSKI